VESILNGTWGKTSPAPPEWVDFLLMRRMHWSWEQLQATPSYVRRYALDFLGLISEAEEAQREKAERKAKRNARTR
jgi:hypothetical protein